MKIGDDGRVTIPRHIREFLGLLPGDEVEWEIRDGEAVVRKALAPADYGRELIEQMRGRGSVRMSTDEIMALTRSE